MTDPNKVTVTLSEPVDFNGQTYTSLTFRKMRAKDVVASDLVEGATRKGFAIFASMANVPLPVIEELDIDDMEQVTAKVAPLMVKSAAAAAAKAAAEKED
jgi:hypothetical protein